MMHATTLPVRLGRRKLLAGTAALLGARTAAAQRPREHFAYVGSTAPEGQGISLWRVNTGDGAMTLAGIFAAENASWLALDASQRVLYAVAETAPDGSISSFAVDRASGVLTPINSVSSRGASPCFVSVHPSGKFVLAANDGSGTIAAFPIGENGALAEASDVQGDPGPAGPARAADSPPGQTAPSDHSGPHMRMVAADPQGHFIVASDAGRDRILRYTLDLGSGKFSPVSDPVTTEPGAAPGHFAFHPDGRTLYSLQEQDGRVVVYDYDPATAAMKEKQSVSALAPDFAGSFLASAIAVSDDGHFVYAALRRHDAIVVFIVDENGRLTRIGEAWTEGADPRSFAFTPDGGLLFACDTRSNAVTAFRVNRMEGALDFVGRYAPVGSPACMVFVG